MSCMHVLLHSIGFSPYFSVKGRRCVCVEYCSAAYVMEECSVLYACSGGVECVVLPGHGVRVSLCCVVCLLVGTDHPCRGR